MGISNLVLCETIQVLGVEQESGEISTGPRQQKEQENSDPYEPRHLKLQFSNNMINGPIYTGRPIGEDLEDTLNLELVDCRTGNIVTYGAEASAKVEIFAVEKDEFKTATSWADGKSLIRRDPHVSLKDGRVSVSHISFKHTRVHMRKCELRLVARVVCPRDIGNRIAKAVTKPFPVMDRRSMPKIKRSLNLDDQVSKLPNIGKGGPYHECLTSKGINTVRDFLTHYFLNREDLLNVRSRYMHAKKLDATVNQAKSKLELKRNVYPGENPQVVFTDVGELIGVNEEGQFLPVEHLTQIQKASGIELVKKAFQDGHQNFNVLLDDDSSEMICSSSSSNNASDHLDGSNSGFTSEANNFPTDPQQLQPHAQPHNDAYYMQTTSLGGGNNYDYNDAYYMHSSSTTLTGALPHPLHPDEDDIINQFLNASWDL